MVQSPHLGVGYGFCPRGRKSTWPMFFDPCWKRGRRLPAEAENLLVSVDSSKTGSEKPSEKRANAIPRKVNPKWSWMCCKSKFGGESCLFGWPITRPHFWPIFWPIRDYHAVDGADFSGLPEVANAAERLQISDYLRIKLCKPQLITRRSKLVAPLPGWLIFGSCRIPFHNIAITLNRCLIRMYQISNS